MPFFKKKTIEELEKERDELAKDVKKKEELDKVKKEIKELKGRSGGFSKEKVLNGWKGVGKGFLKVLKETGKATTKFAEKTAELEANAKKEKNKKGKKQSSSLGFEPGAVSMEKAFGMDKPKGGKKDGYIF